MRSLYCRIRQSSAISAMTFIIRMMRVVWNDSEIGIVWPGIESVYKGSASAAGYRFDEIPLNLCSKYQKWLDLRNIFKF